MKNASLLINIVLLLAVVVLYVLHFTQGPIYSNSEPGLVGKTAPGPGFGPNENVKIAFVNTDTLLEHYDYFSKKRQELEARGKQVETDLAGRMRRLENEYLTAKSKVDKGTMSQSLMIETEKDLARKQQEIQVYKEEQAGKLMEQEKAINLQLNNNIRNYMKAYGKTHGCRYVLGMSGAGGVLYANDSLDITKQILEGLNNEFKGKQE